MGVKKKEKQTIFNKMGWGFLRTSFMFQLWMHQKEIKIRIVQINDLSNKK